MLMIGDMFNHDLKARVDRMCAQLAGVAAATRTLEASARDAATSGGVRWWPEGLGLPSSSGAQNDMRYAFFPTERRPGDQRWGAVTVYDTGGPT